jgi:hypothetical protein
MRCIRIGNGAVAPLHRAKLAEIGVETAGVVEIDPARRDDAARQGLRVFGSIAEAFASEPDFWDVCVGSRQHLAVLEEIVGLDRRACVIVEKPVCVHSQLDALHALLERFSGKLAVNENYLSSTVTHVLRTLAFERLRIGAPARVVVEMTKNRGPDFARGRFLDEESGAIGYEGSHMLTVLELLGEDLLPPPGHAVEARAEDAEVGAPGGRRLLRRQGAAEVRWTSATGVEVELYTSMVGATKHRFAPYQVGDIRPGSGARYRVAAVEGHDRRGRPVSVVGFYEPIATLGRALGAVAVLREGRVRGLLGPIPDDSMGVHLGRIVEYFRRGGENPSPVERAAKVAASLHALGAAAKGAGAVHAAA